MVPLAHLDSKANRVSKVFPVLLDSLDHLDLLVTLAKMDFLVFLEREERSVKPDPLANPEL